MASKMYDTGRASMANGGVNWLTDTIKAVLVTNGYTPNTAAHAFLSDLGASTIGTAQALTSKTNVAGLLSAANPSFAGIASATIPYVVIYKDTGTAGTSQLVCLLDGIELATCAAAAAAAATVVTIDPLFTPLASGSTVVFGGVTATLTAIAAAGARSLTVSALSGTIAAGVVGTSSAQGAFPFVAGSAVTIMVSFDVTNGILKL